MEPVTTICTQSVVNSPQEIIVASQNIQSDCLRGG